MEEKALRVAITHGDINGTGYEMILKAFEEPAILELCTPIVYGSPKVASYYANILNSEIKFNVIEQADQAQPDRLNILNCFGDEELKIDMGTATPESAKAAKQAIDRAVNDYKSKKFDVLVTLPVNRSSISGFNGHADYLERHINSSEKGISILLGDDVRVALVTNNLAVRDIAEAITKQKIVEKTKLFYNALRRDLRISSPRIAVLSLNPRCGEDGALGDEEQDIIIPAIKELEQAGVQAFGPYAADYFFGQGNYYHFDGVLAMYHDQGLGPYKTLTPDFGVRLTSGLPIVRTAPAVSTQFDIAGKQKADPDSLRHAIYTAIDVYRNRINYDEPLANPLQKLYHEKRDDSEKVRFRSSEGHAPFAPKNGKGGNKEESKEE